MPGHATTTCPFDPTGRLQTQGPEPAATTSSGSPTIHTRRPATNGDPDSYVRSYAANGLNQYSGTTSTGAAPAAYSYDPNGNLASDGTRFYVYDVENRLASASGGASAALVYDPLGRLFQTSGGTAGIAQFLYDGDELVSEFNSAGTVLRRYIHGPGSDDPLVWYEGPSDWDRRSLIANHQGSIVGAVSAAGASAPVNSYDPWGIPGAGNNGRFGYTGQVWIPELGLWYYKARFYSPTVGRFLQVDPIGYDDQINLYAYVSNDPVNGTDPTGMQESFELATRRDDKAFLAGEISEEEYRERQQARGAGGAIGGAIVAAVILTRGAALTPMAAFQAGGIAGRRAFMGMQVPMTISAAQFGAKFGSHMKEWGLAAGRTGADKFRAIINSIGTRPDRVVNGTFSGAGGRVPVQFRIKGNDVVVTSRKGEFVTALKDGINSTSVQNALKQTCTGSLIARTVC